MKEASFFVSILLSLVCAPAVVTAFVSPITTTTPTRMHHRYQPSKLFSSSGKESKWKVDNDFTQFLNQCTVQSFLIVLGSLRDPQTSRWVDNFTAPIFYDGEDRKSVRLTGTTAATRDITAEAAVTNPTGDTSLKLLKYHGLGCMNTTKFPSWDSYFSTLLEQPEITIDVQSFNSLSKDYAIDINPASLCTRMISVREQIAEEMAHDLGIVAENMGRHTMDSYWDHVDQQRDKEEEDDDDDDDNDIPDLPSIGAATAADSSSTIKDEVTMSSGADGSPRILPPHNLVFLDYALDPIDGRTPSALRRGNFDLLVLLATQESIVRILNNEHQQQQHGDDDDDEDDDQQQSNMYRDYLREFYKPRIASHFSGIQRYGRADDFLEELLFVARGSSAIDPVRLAEMILNERRQVALEWQAQSQDVPNDHFAIKRLQLDRLMQSYQ